MLNDLAPIGLSTYIRLPHLQRTISKLRENKLAKQSNLYVFSDAPKAGDEAQVAEVRSFLRSVNGFKQIHIIERTKNSRTENSRRGLQMLLKQFGKVIFLEEDIVTAPGFLTFMNQALNKYAENDLIFSVVGYCPPIRIPPNYHHDIFLLRRFNGWGFGIWKNRYDTNKDITPEEYEQFATNKNRVKDFIKSGGADMMAMLKEEAYGLTDAWDIKALFTQFLSNQYTIYPTKSLIQNIGLDGTGIHCGTSDKFNVTLSTKTTFQFPDKPIVDKEIIKASLVFYDGSIYKRLRAQILSRIPKTIKKRIPKQIKRLFQPNVH